MFLVIKERVTINNVKSVIPRVINLDLVKQINRLELSNSDSKSEIVLTTGDRFISGFTVEEIADSMSAISVTVQATKDSRPVSEVEFQLKRSEDLFK